MEKYWVGFDRLFIVLFPGLFFFAHIATSQESITISEGTLKVGGVSEEAFYFGLSEGDQLLFTFNEVKKKELKEVEVLEWPGTSRFFEYKTKGVKEKVLQIQNTGIYKLRLKNTALGGRVCHYRLERIPANPDKKFNSTVYWATKRDTSYYTIEEEYLVSKDTNVVDVIPHQVHRVHSQTASNGKPNKAFVKVDLPANTASWSYYLGVGKDSEEVFLNAEKKAKKTRGKLTSVSKLGQSLATLDLSGSLTMASLALNGIAEFAIPDKADNIQYWITDYENARLFMTGYDFRLYDKGNGPLVYKRMSTLPEGPIYFCLLNDNLMEGIDVHMRVAAITVTENWGKRSVERYTVRTWKEPYLKN